MHFCVFFKIIRQCIVELIFPRLWSAFISMTRTRAIIIMNLMNYKDLPTRHWKQILTTTKNTHLHNSVGEALCETCWNLFAAGWNWFITHSHLLRSCNMISVVILHGSLLTRLQGALMQWRCGLSANQHRRSPMLAILYGLLECFLCIYSLHSSLIYFIDSPFTSTHDDVVLLMCRDWYWWWSDAFSIWLIII